MKSLPDEILVQVIRHGLERFVVKNIEGKSTEGLQSYFVKVGLICNCVPMLPKF